MTTTDPTAGASPSAHPAFGRLVVRTVSVRTAGHTVGVRLVAGRGSGPPLLMLHGLGASGLAYRKLVRALAHDVSAIVLPDYPGHGLSRPWPTTVTTPLLVRAVLDVLEQVATEPLVYFGNSLGGYGAIAAASQRPELARGVFVTSPSGGALPDHQRARVIQRFQPQNHRAAVSLVERAMPDAGPVKRHGLAVASRLLLSRKAVRDLAGTAGASDDFTPEHLRRLTMPVRVLWGTGERALDPEQREWFRTHLPQHAELHEPEGWGHAAFRDRPAEVLAELRAFLQRV